MSRLMRLLFAASVVGLGAFPSLGAAAAVNIAIEPHDSGMAFRKTRRLLVQATSNK